jgi:hypothetical protein
MESSVENDSGLCPQEVVSNDNLTNTTETTQLSAQNEVYPIPPLFPYNSEPLDKVLLPTK